MNKTNSIKAIKALPNMTARATGYGTEIRVTRKDVSKDRAEQIAYYSECPDDAFNTAQLMSAHIL